MKIEEGLYVRTQDGHIGKITRHEHYWLNNEEWDYVITDIGLDFDIDKILKTSDNIIDLIEVGDYVNGCLVVKKYKECDYAEQCIKLKGNSNYFYDIDVHSLLTKEQFERVSYNVKRDYNMKEQIINKYIDTIYDIIANINNEQEEHFIEDLDYIKTHLECAINYKEILEENKELQERIDKYEDPEDLTLMFMYCDEKAKDKIKELQEELEMVDDRNNDLVKICQEYEGKINKAIEYIDKEWRWDGTGIDDLEEILRGE